MMHLSITTICFATSSRCLSESRTDIAGDWLLRVVGRMRSDVLDHGMLIHLSHA